MTEEDARTLVSVFSYTLLIYSDLSFSPTTVDHKHAIAASLTRFALPFVDGLSDFCAALCALAKWTVLDLARTLVQQHRLSALLLLAARWWFASTPHLDVLVVSLRYYASTLSRMGKIDAAIACRPCWSGFFIYMTAMTLLVLVPLLS